MLQKEVSLLEWCKLHSFSDIYAQLTRLEFSHPSDFCHLSEKDLNDLCHYLNLKFGRKAKFLSAVNSIKMTLQKASPLNALPLTQEEYRKIEIILCAKERFIQCDDKLQSMIDQVENNNKLLKVEIQSQFEIFTNKLHTLLSQSLYEVEEKSADFLDMINHIRYTVNDTLKQFINYEISAKKAISIFELSQMAVRSATLNELFLKTSNLSVPNLIESLPSITVKFHPIFDIKDHEISHLLQISDLPSSILLPNDHLQTHLNQSFDYEKEIGEWTKSDEEDQREEGEMIIHSIPSPLTSSFQSYDIPHHFTPDYLTACQYLRSSNAQEKRKRREEREGGKRKARGRDQREDDVPSLSPSSSIPPRLVILLAGPSSVGKSTFISKFVIGNEGEGSDYSSSSLAPSSPPSSSSPQSPSTVPSPSSSSSSSSSSSVTLQTNVGDIIVEFREINTIKPKDEDQRKIIQSANGVVLLFDVTSRSSFKNIQSFYSSISRISGRIPMILCGNKIDRGNRVMMMMKKTSLYRLRNLSYYDLSLLFDFNIEKPLLYLLRKLTRCDHLSFLLSSFSSSSSFLSPLPANSPLSSPIPPSPLSPPSPPPISSPLDPPPPLSSPSFSLSLSLSCSSIPPPSIDRSDDPLEGEFLLSDDHPFDVHNQSDDDDDVIENIHEYSQSHHVEEEIMNDDDDDDDVVYDSNNGGREKDAMNKLEKKKQKKKQQKKESKEEKMEEREDEKKEEVNESIDFIDSTASIDFIDSTASIASIDSIDSIDSTASLPPTPSLPSIPLPSSLGSSLSPSCSLTSSCDIFIPTQPPAPSLLSQSTPSLSTSFSSSSLSRSSFSNLSSSSAIDHKITIWEFRILSDQIRGPFVIGFARKPHPNYDDRDYDHYHDEIDQYQLQYWGLSNNGYLIDSDHILLSQKICDDLQMDDQVSVVFNDRLKEVKWVVNGVELEIKLQVNDCAENYFGFVGRSRGDLNLDHLNALDDDDSDFDRYHDNDNADENDDCDAVKLIHCSSY